MVTTDKAGIGILATMPRKTAGAQLTEIYAKRQARRPHYLAKIMERRDVSRAKLLEDLGVDKSQLSRWLDDDRPSTPSPVWALKLGQYFSSGPDDDDLVDIFTDPDLARFQKMTKGRPPDEVDRMLATLEAAFPRKRTG